MSAISATSAAPSAADFVRIPSILRGEVQVRSDTFKEDDRTVEVVWAEGAAVKRYSWDDGWYMEELSMDPKHIRMDRFATGMSLLDSHDAYSMDSRIGTVVPGSVRVTGGQGIATVKLSRNARGESLLQDLRDGHPFQISVGYRTHAYEKTEGSDKALPVLRAIDWEPLELSAVPIPADAGAHTRSEPSKGLVDVPVGRQSHPPKGNHTMDDDLLEAPAQTNARREPADLIRPKATARRSYAEHHGVNDVEGFVARTEGFSERQVRAATLEEMVSAQERTATFPHVETRGLEPGNDRFTGMTEAIRARLQPSFKAGAQAAPYMGLSFVEMARRSLEISGGSTSGLYGGNVVDMALGQRGFHSTSDFGPALGNAFRDVLLAEFEALASPIAKAFRSETASDFRDVSFIQGVAGSDLLPVNEHGEFRRGPLLGESAEKARLGTYGRITPITRQVIVNDQLGAISRFIDEPAKKAAELEANLMLAQLESSTILMSDGLPLFDPAHKNVATSPSALTEASLNAAILAVEKGHRHANGSTIFQRPRYLIVPSELRLTATKLLAEVQATKTSDVNPLAGSLEIIVEPRLSSATAWYVVADPQRSAGGIFLRLAGQEKPYVDFRFGFDVDGIEVKVRHDCGAGFADYRSWYRNAGA